MSIKYLSDCPLLACIALAAAAMTLPGCEKQPEPAAPAPVATTAQDDHDHDDDHAHEAGEDHDHEDDHDHGPTTQLGEQVVSGFTVKASRDGEIKAGGDAPVDVWVTGGAAKVSTARFWIGSQDARGSVKARAELEKDNWHTHVEVPAPLPEGSRLWVEIETASGEKIVAGFDLKM